MGRLLLYDALAMRFDEVKLRRDPACPLCSPNATILELQDYPAFCGTGRGGTPSPSRRSAPRELKRRLDAGEPLEIIDVREPHEWAICRIEGARLVPLGSLAARLHELDSARTYVLQCRSGERSARALGLLRQAGFRRAAEPARRRPRLGPRGGPLDAHVLKPARLINLTAFLKAGRRLDPVLIPPVRLLTPS